MAGTPVEPFAGGQVPGDAPGDTVRWRLDLSYDGARFRGFAEQGTSVPTVAGTLARALQQVTRSATPPTLVCAGRTDAGVHARGQVVHVDLPADLPVVRAPGGGGRVLGPEDLVRSVNRRLSPSIVVRSAGPAAEGFDARRSAIARRYRYLVWNAEHADPLLAPLAWHLRDPLDGRSLAAGADVLVGRHDFRAFCRRPPGHPADLPIERRVRQAGWSVAPAPTGAPEGTLYRFEIEADAFCHQMVRSIVAVLAGVGSGRYNVAQLVGLLTAGSRQGLPRPAPPEGLCLLAVTYPG